MGTITSSEFREGCKGMDSFISTIRHNTSTTRGVLDKSLECEVNKSNDMNKLNIEGIKNINV